MSNPSWKQSKALVKYVASTVGVKLLIDIVVNAADTAVAKAEVDSWDKPIPDAVPGVAFYVAAARTLGGHGVTRESATAAIDYAKRQAHREPNPTTAEGFIKRLAYSGSWEGPKAKAKAKSDTQAPVSASDWAAGRVAAAPAAPVPTPAPAPAPVAVHIVQPTFDDAGLLARVEAALAAGTLAEEAAEVLLGLPGGADRPAVLAALKAAGLGLGPSLAAARVWFA